MNFKVGWLDKGFFPQITVNIAWFDSAPLMIGSRRLLLYFFIMWLSYVKSELDLAVSVQIAFNQWLRVLFLPFL